MPGNRRDRQVSNHCLLAVKRQAKAIGAFYTVLVVPLLADQTRISASFAGKIGSAKQTQWYAWHSGWRMRRCEGSSTCSGK